MAKRLLEGLKFRPTDQELINDYLFNKIVGKELPFEGIILERDVYDEQVLSQIFRSWDESGDTRSYFFTRLKKKAANYCRTVGNGTWRSQYSRVINDGESNTIGIKRSLEYMNIGSVQHKKWIMMEFSLAGVSLEQPRSSKDYVICMLQKSRGGKHGKEETMQSNRNGDEALTNIPSDCFNNKRIKLTAKQNQRMENDTSAMPPSGNSSASIVGAQVGLIHGEAGVKTLEQLTQDPLAPDSSMENVANVVAADTLATLLPSGHYDVPDSILPFDNMPPLMQAEPSPIVDEEGGYASEASEVRMQPSVADQSLHSSNAEFDYLRFWTIYAEFAALASAPEVPAAENDVGNLVQPSIADQSLLSSNPKYAVLDYICSLASALEVTEAESDVGILEQPCNPAPESLPADSHGHVVLNSVISLATPTPMVEPSVGVSGSYC